MKVLLTGHLGFVGQHVAKRLVSDGHSVVGWDRKSTDGEAIDVATLDDYVSARRHALETAHGVQAVIHCAAKADISRNWASKTERDELFWDNVQAPWSLCEFFAGRSLSHVVFVSTLAVTDWESSPYAATKVFGERVTKAWASAFAWNSVIVRPASCVGVGYRHGHIADFVRKARECPEGFEALDDGRTRKPYVHVETVAKAIADSLRICQDNAVLECVDGMWGWVDTARVMGIDVRPKLGIERGWKGDPLFLGRAACTDRQEEVERGVREALDDLGWKR